MDSAVSTPAFPGDAQLAAVHAQVAARCGRDAAWPAFDARLQRHLGTLRGELAALYGHRDDFPSFLADLLVRAFAAWRERDPALKALDDRREHDPEWFQSNTMLGGVCYVDLFAGPWQSQSGDYSDTSFGIALKRMSEAKAKQAELGRSVRMVAHLVEKDPKNHAELVEAVRQSHGVVIAAPGYHGTISGLVKNALDYLEDLARDRRPYLDGRAVGLIATAYGDQATMSTLLTLRSIVHALRGWPTPMGATIKTYQGLFSPDGECLDDRARLQLELVGSQTVRGARALASLDRGQ